MIRMKRALANVRDISLISLFLFVGTFILIPVLLISLLIQTPIFEGQLLLTLIVIFVVIGSFESILYQAFRYNVGLLEFFILNLSLVLILTLLFCMVPDTTPIIWILVGTDYLLLTSCLVIFKVAVKYRVAQHLFN